MQIVIASTKPELEIIERGRTDLGERHKFKEIQIPLAMMWLNEGTEEDKEKAEDYARKNDSKVFCYYNEREPLERARRDIMKDIKGVNYIGSNYQSNQRGKQRLYDVLEI